MWFTYNCVKLLKLDEFLKAIPNPMLNDSGYYVRARSDWYC